MLSQNDKLKRKNELIMSALEVDNQSESINTSIKTKDKGQHSKNISKT